VRFNYTGYPKIASIETFLKGAYLFVFYPYLVLGLTIKHPLKKTPKKNPLKKANYNFFGFKLLYFCNLDYHCYALLLIVCLGSTGKALWLFMQLFGTLKARKSAFMLI